MRQIRGIAWDHPRAMAPLRLASAEFEASHGVRVTWATRSLAGFEEAGIADLASRYDLVAIDHPFMGTSYAEGALLPVESVLDAGFLDTLSSSSVGPSWGSYLWQGHHWATPIDAAAQVSARRADLTPAELDHVPSWGSVPDVARERPGRVAIALNPTHMFLTTLTICHAIATTTEAAADLTPAWWSNETGADPAVLTPAIERLTGLYPLLHPASAGWDPIQLLDRMTSTDEIDYVPAVFGYCSYARTEDADRPVRFGDVPGHDGRRRGGMLGGVGLAVSGRCELRAEVAAFLAFVAGREFQTNGYASSGGQPAHRDAWTSPNVNRWTPGFFESTLPSLDAAFVRPRVARYPRYQVEAGRLLHRNVLAGVSAKRTASDLRELWRELGGTERA